ncbi:uncharacterized protein LOC130085747 [Rhinichthys klamathensis goyatoka]|uniref:uncharacterized protein LOC130085747 n=1 Tax=Rhinichthys klamathensis goyatoka TaxID=3034132 RepID=UPI0024B49D2F|nr:uncharacterized protein LOC130085747 [Rhinichthys klamathensis goyatoka]
MPDRLTLLALSFSLILHNVSSSWTVSEPLNQTLNDDGSVSVTCMFYGDENFGLEAKLKMNDKFVCEIYQKGQEHDQCTWQHNNNTFTFTLKNPGALHKNEFSCQITKISPLPIQSFKGPKTKLFRGYNNPPPKSSCSCYNKTHNQEHTVEDKPSPSDMYTLLIGGLVIVVVMLCLYSLILTAFFIRLRVAKPEPSDTLTYVPMQRNIKRRDPDDTEYVDMREVQKRGGSHRDMNHNSHMMTA